MTFIILSIKIETKKVPIELRFAQCEVCGQKTPHLIYIKRRLLYVFFPLIPIPGGRQARCLYCGRTVPPHKLRKWKKVPIEEYEGVLRKVVLDKIKVAVDEFERRVCANCGKQLRFIQAYNRYYCDYCRQYSV